MPPLGRRHPEPGVVQTGEGSPAVLPDGGASWGDPSLRLKTGYGQGDETMKSTELKP